jgi:hypothetical protein
MEERSRRLVELAQLFTRLGFTAFGGLAAHIAMMQYPLQKRWECGSKFCGKSVERGHAPPHRGG